MFKRISNALRSACTKLTQAISSIYGGSTIDTKTLASIKTSLIEGDVGAKTAHAIVEKLKMHMHSDATPPTDILESILLEILASAGKSKAQDVPITLLVGINGAGKTSAAAKLANRFAAHGQKVLLVAADTFRAAATEQLADLASRINVPIFVGKPKQDPASVVFGACSEFLEKNYDRMIIDTAGRIQTHTNLMNEMAKIRRVIGKQIPEESVETLVTIDSVLGQNSLEQARLFQEYAHATEVLLTKVDSSARGGIVLAIAHELKLPIAYVSFGENLADLKPFSKKEYVSNLIGSSTQESL